MISHPSTTLDNTSADECDDTDRPQGLASSVWVYGLDFWGDAVLWQELARRILLHPSRPHPPEAAETLTRMGKLLAIDLDADGL